MMAAVRQFIAERWPTRELVQAHNALVRARQRLAESAERNRCENDFATEVVRLMLEEMERDDAEDARPAH